MARREGLSAEDALDVAQETFRSFLCLPQARPLVEVPEDSAKLLTVLARNLARNARRRRERRRETRGDPESVADPLPTPDVLIAQAEDFALAVGCMDTLGKLQRAVVSLRLLDDVAGEEAARLLDAEPGHVAVLLHRAKLNLRECMLDAGYDEIRKP